MKKIFKRLAVAALTLSCMATLTALTACDQTNTPDTPDDQEQTETTTWDKSYYLIVVLDENEQPVANKKIPLQFCIDGNDGICSSPMLSFTTDASGKIKVDLNDSQLASMGKPLFTKNDNLTMGLIGSSMSSTEITAAGGHLKLTQETTTIHIK